MQISTKGNGSLGCELSGVILYIDYKIYIEIKILVITNFGHFGAV